MSYQTIYIEIERVDRGYWSASWRAEDDPLDQRGRETAVTRRRAIRKAQRALQKRVERARSRERIKVEIDG